MAITLTTGAKFPGTGSTVDRSSGTAWTTATAITADDTSYAVQSGAGVTDYLIGSNYNFSIPAWATIVGVTVRVAASETGTGNGAYTVSLNSAATPTLIGTPKGPTTVSGTTIVESSNGSATDVWGATLTPAIVNSSGFGVSLYSDDTVNVHSIDYITVEVHYTLPAFGIIGPAHLTPWARSA
jgi:hypothetical protein